MLGRQAALLPHADVHHRRAEKRTLLDAGRRVADQARRVREQRHELVGGHVGDEAHLRRSAPSAARACGAGCRPSRRCPRRDWARTRSPAGRARPRRAASSRGARGCRASVVTGCCTTIRNGCATSMAWPTPKLLTRSLVIACVTRDGQLDVERAGVEDVARILAHRQHAPLGIGVGHKVQVRQLGDGVADALVDAAGDVAALDVRNRDVQVGGGHRDRQLLEPVAADHHHVGIAACRGRW